MFVTIDWWGCRMPAGQGTVLFLFFCLLVCFFNSFSPATVFQVQLLLVREKAVVALTWWKLYINADWSIVIIIFVTLCIATQTATLLYFEILSLCRTSMPYLLPQHQENTLVFPLYVPMWQSLFVHPIRLCLVVCICMQSMLERRICN